jgi:hypothetical protein
MTVLESQAKREARDRRDKTIIGLIIIFLMVFSTLGYVFWWREDEQDTNNPDIKVYNNYTFTRTDSGWQTVFDVGGKNTTLMTSYLPEELENVTVKGTVFTATNLSGKALYLVATSINERQTASEFAFFGPWVQRMQMACLEENVNDSFCVEQNLPIKSCSDANSEAAIIIVKETEIDPRVIYDGGCLSVKGQGANLTMAAEKAVFLLLGITK